MDSRLLRAAEEEEEEEEAPEEEEPWQLVEEKEDIKKCKSF